MPHRDQSLHDCVHYDRTWFERPSQQSMLIAFLASSIPYYGTNFSPTLKSNLCYQVVLSHILHAYSLSAKCINRRWDKREDFDVGSFLKATVTCTSQCRACTEESQQKDTTMSSGSRYKASHWDDTSMYKTGCRWWSWSSRPSVKARCNLE